VIALHSYEHVTAVLVVPLMTVLLGGGLIGALLTFVISRRQDNRAARKAPLDEDFTIVGSAEKAVLLMERSLNAANTRITELEIELRKEREAMQELRAEMEALRAELHDYRVGDRTSQSRTRWDDDE
jgi:predicted RNase H-like nuclease (RuvC/YqgF family)